MKEYIVSWVETVFRETRVFANSIEEACKCVQNQRYDSNDVRVQSVYKGDCTITDCEEVKEGVL
jgi:hypothetical protein